MVCAPIAMPCKPNKLGLRSEGFHRERVNQTGKGAGGQSVAFADEIPCSAQSLGCVGTRPARRRSRGRTALSAWQATAGGSLGSTTDKGPSPRSGAGPIGRNDAAAAGKIGGSGRVERSQYRPLGRAEPASITLEDLL